MIFNLITVLLYLTGAFVFGFCTMMSQPFLLIVLGITGIICFVVLLVCDIHLYLIEYHWNFYDKHNIR